MRPYYGYTGGVTLAKRVLRNKPVMISHAYVNKNIDQLLSVVGPVVIDSGAFTLWNKGVVMTPQYIQRYLKFVQDYRERLSWAVSPDQIGDAQVSYDRWVGLTAQGHDLVPVYHEGDPVAHLHTYNPNERLVALGRIEGRRSPPKTMAFYDLAFSLYPQGRFHALGVCHPRYLEPYPFESFDAVTWHIDSNHTHDHPWPWNQCDPITRYRAYIEAIDKIQHRPG